MKLAAATKDERARWRKMADDHDTDSTCGAMLACCDMATGIATDAIRILLHALTAADVVREQLEWAIWRFDPHDADYRCIYCNNLGKERGHAVGCVPAEALIAYDARVQ